jgi:beta-galactosidase
MHDQYFAINDSPLQRRFRRMAPMPIGCVFVEWPGMTLDAMRGHFRLMRELGYTCLKQLGTCPGTDRKAVMHAALDEGIIPWWYGEACFEEPTPELLRELGIAETTAIDQVLEHPVYRERQLSLMRARIDRGEAPAAKTNLQAGVSQGATPFEPMPLSIGTDLDPAFEPRFLAWLRERYRTPQALADAWNLHHYDIADGSGMTSLCWVAWDDVRDNWRKLKIKEYRHLIDLLLFKAHDRNQGLVAAAESHHARDPLVPFRAGGEMGCFLPFAARATDMEGIAETMRDHGSFYPSIHFAWHFEEVQYEVARTIYMQAALCTDWFKGGWAATWESTGGPQQLSGGKAWNIWRAQETPGFTCDEGTMSQLLFSYLGAGFKGVGQWCWTPRTAGWEAGEFALLDRNGAITERARRGGAIGKAMRHWRRELWDAVKEPTVGVFTDFECEAVWAAISHSGRDAFQNEPIHARIGVSRALIDANIPFEHVTARNLRAGLASRYPVIYLPAMIGFPHDLLELLTEYVRGGGRLVMDLPGCWYGTDGRLMPTGEGSAFARLFGVHLADFQYSNNRPRCIGDLPLTAWCADLTLQGAITLATYDSGAPAITEHRLGKGSAVILGWDASLQCFRPGNRAHQDLLITHTLGSLPVSHRCDTICFRLPSPTADHWFLINDGPERMVEFEPGPHSYGVWSDAVSGEVLTANTPIHVDGWSGRWIRTERLTTSSAT